MHKIILRKVAKTGLLVYFCQFFLILLSTPTNLSLTLCKVLKCHEYMEIELLVEWCFPQDSSGFPQFGSNGSWLPG